MTLDSSVLVAILFGEPGHLDLVEQGLTSPLVDRSRRSHPGQ
jgi:hypothetical protein